MNTQTIVPLEPGDRIYRQSGLIKHYGVYAGGGWVMHNMPEKGEHFVTYDEFRIGQQVMLEKRCPLEERPQVLATLQAKAGNRQKYDLLSHNCEHTAMEITEQKSMSLQVNGLIAVLGIAALLFVIVKSEA